MSPNVLSKTLKTVVLASTTFGSFLIYYLPNTVFLDEVQKIMQLYKTAEPVPVSPCIQKLNQDVMNDMEISIEDRDKIRLFMNSTFGFFYMGSIWSHHFHGGFYQAIIGIPANFNWESVDKEAKEDITLNKNAVDWSSESGQMLTKSFTISEKAKKFALAQQVFYISKCEPFVKSILTASLTLLTFYYFGVIKKFPKRFKGLRYVGYFVSATFNLLVWVMFKDIYRCHLEGQADKAVAALGKEYVEGGLEMYESILSRNIAMRELMGKKGEAKYSLFGNEQMLIRQTNLPLTARRDFFKDLA